MTIATVLAAIAAGDLDADLARVNTALNARIKAKRTMDATMNVAMIAKGDTVRIVGNIRPKYMVGLTATVVDTNRTRVVVNFPDTAAAGRFRNATRVTVPATCVEVVTAAA